MISTLRIEDTSIFNYIKYELLPKSFIESLTGISLSYDSNLGCYVPDLTDLEPSPTSRGRGLVPFDDSLVNGSYIVDVSAEQSSKVSITGVTSCTIDYIRGYIYNPNVVPTTIDFNWYYVSVLDSWPGRTPPSLPIVSVDVVASTAVGLQLGGGKINQRDVVLYVFATSRSERDEITDLLVEGLLHRTLTVKDYSQGDYLSYDGTFNTSFDHTPAATSPIYINDVSARFLGTDVSWDSLNKYRSDIKVSYESISEA